MRQAKIPSVCGLSRITLPSDFFRRKVVLSFQQDAIGIRLRDSIGVGAMLPFLMVNV